jgi:hypothetical protein
MNPEIQLWNFLSRLYSDGHWGGCCALIAIWLLYRQRRYSSELSARQQQRELSLVNETWKRAFETMLREQPRRLRDLVDDTESESSLRP